MILPHSVRADDGERHGRNKKRDEPRNVKHVETRGGEEQPALEDLLPQCAHVLHERVLVAVVRHHRRRRRRRSGRRIAAAVAVGGGGDGGSGGDAVAAAAAILILTVVAVVRGLAVDSGCGGSGRRRRRGGFDEFTDVVDGKQLLVYAVGVVFRESVGSILYGGVFGSK